MSLGRNAHLADEIADSEPPEAVDHPQHYGGDLDYMITRMEKT